MFKQTLHDKQMHGTLEKPQAPPSVEHLIVRSGPRCDCSSHPKREDDQKKKYDKADIWPLGEARSL